MPGLQGTPTTSEDESDDPQPEMPAPTQQDLGWADGGAEDEAQAIEMARREMEMVLQDADSLETVGALKKSYGRVRGHLDSQIMRILQSKIDESEDWVKLFKQSLEHITQIETNFAEIEAECEVCSRRVKQWDTIKTFNRARNNVTSSLGELQLNECLLGRHSVEVRPAAVAGRPSEAGERTWRMARGGCRGMRSAREEHAGGVAQCWHLQPGAQPGAQRRFQES